MRNNAIDGTESVYDSRDIIERIDELQQTEDVHGELPALTPEETAELAELLKLADECEDIADWHYGETLIARDYWVDYIKELIHDCYEMPKEIDSGAWPYRHMTMDYAAAAEEAEQDYKVVSLFGNDYLIRNC